MSTRTMLRPLLLAGFTLAGVCVGLAVRYAVANDGESWSSDGIGPGIRGSGVMREDTRSLDAFDAVLLESSADVDITVGGPQQVRVEADDNLLDHIDTRVRGHQLIVGSHGSYRSRHRIAIHLTLPALTRVQLDGSGDIAIAGLDGGDLQLVLNGSGNIHARGRSDGLDAVVDGSGNLRLADLDSRDARARVDGSGDIELSTRESIDASIGGSGSIRYRGHPARVRKSVSGSGDVHDM